MTTASIPAPSEDAANVDDAPARQRSVPGLFWQSAHGYFFSERRWLRRAALGGLLALSAAQTYILVRINLWNVDFFNALERRDVDTFVRQSLILILWVAASIAVAVIQLHMRMNLQVSWRRWLTRHLIGTWVDAGRHYQLTFMTGDHDNPDQRIADDARLATESAIDFIVGITDNLLLLIAFVGILWSVSGTLSFAVSDTSVAVPGYMVWAALLYAGIGSFLAFRLGRPLVRINVDRRAREGDLRFRLVRVREESEGIALCRGEADERAGLDQALTDVVRVWRTLIAQLRSMMALSTGYGLLAPFFPVVVAAPHYFAGAIALGGLMQIVGAFAQVQRGLSWFVDNFARYSEWAASVRRVAGFTDALEALERDRSIDTGDGIIVAPGSQPMLRLRDLDIAYPDGAIVVANATGDVAPGERVLVVGESGTGKSTLMRCIAGLWPWGRGAIDLPPDCRFMFLPQRPYLPLGTLRAALAYPSRADAFDDATLRAALERVDLAGLADRLDDEERWDHILSGGEQQKLAFARLLLQQPDWIVMDEATAALDENSQTMLMALLSEELAGATVISIGHRPGLESYHDRTVVLVRGEEGARLVRKRRPAQPKHGTPRRESRLRRLFKGR
ncbi:MAG TPA: ABC transporter ATP-binding protein/permease [Vineibacter sp.]|nr:ABC transporter ATP-binding protein/permease [Vineibacter sp.]